MENKQQKGFILFIIGGSGSGKTSLLKELEKRGYLKTALKFGERKQRDENDDTVQLTPAIQKIDGETYFIINEDPPFYYRMNGLFYAFEPIEMFKQAQEGARLGMVLSNVATIKNIKRLAANTGYDIDFKVVAIEHNISKEGILSDRTNKTERLASAKEIAENIELKKEAEKLYLNQEISFEEIKILSPIDYIFQKQPTVEQLADAVIKELNDDSYTMQEKLHLKNIKQEREKLK